MSNRARLPPPFRPPHAARIRLWLVLVPFAWLCAAMSTSAASDAGGFVIIVNRANPTAAAERAFVASAFLKKTTRWGNGELIRPVDLRPGSALRERFSRAILKRGVGAVRNYWQQRIFSGRDTPPPVFDSEESVIAYVAKHPGAVGYVSDSADVAAVQVLQVK